MNATTYINSAHKALSRNPGGLTIEELSGKLRVKALKVSQQIRELHDAGLIETTEDAGQPVYRLIAAPAAEMAEPLDFATSPEVQYLAPEDYQMPPADPALLAMANRTLSEQLDEYRGQLAHIATTAADYLPDPSDITTARAVEIMDMLIEAQREQIDALSAKLLTKDNELVLQARRAIELGVKIDEQDQSIDSLTKDVINTRAALNKAINEADRLRRELTDAQEVTDAAVGYLVRAPKRKPRYIVKPERAREAALAAVRAGAGRADVLAVVPVGVARRGAEWQGINPRPNGD